MLVYVQEVDGMNQAVASHEGCHVYGWLDVKRVAANFHISVHVEDYMLLAQVSLRNCPTSSLMKSRHFYEAALRDPVRTRWM